MTPILPFRRRHPDAAEVAEQLAEQWRKVGLPPLDMAPAAFWVSVLTRMAGIGDIKGFRAEVLRILKERGVVR